MSFTVYSDNADERKDEYKKSVRDLFAKVGFTRSIQAVATARGVRAPQTPAESNDQRPSSKDVTIGIIGAGAAGLYAALILDSLDIKYEILEGSGRVGGRIFTHHFSPAPYDYFDVGAMRFPRLWFMRRLTIHLFSYLDINDKVVPYYLQPKKGHDKVVTSYNGVNVFGNADHELSSHYKVESDPKHPNVGTLDKKYAGKTIQDIFRSSFEWMLEPYRSVNDNGISKEERRKRLEAAENDLKAIDIFSTRGFLALLGDVASKTEYDAKAGTVPIIPPIEEILPRAFVEKLGMPPAAIQWLETTTTGTTGWFDEGLSQTIMELADFDTNAVKLSGWVPPDSPLKHNKWVCLDGGSQVIVDGMVKKLGLDPKTVVDKRVTSVKDVGKKLSVSYSTGSDNGTQEYDQVICTAALGCIASMDMGECLSYPQKVAVRSLQYDASCKIGVRFKTRWWQDESFMPHGKIFGGVSKTDTPLSNIVYPSYGDGYPNAPGVLICSYTWAQDAKRLGALIGPGGEMEKDGELYNLVLRYLAEVHGVGVESLAQQYETSYCYAWANDPFYRGAFAIFGPAQFYDTSPTSDHKTDGISLFDSIKLPAAHGKLHIGGEATSTHHGWIIGALNSAYRCVNNVLRGLSDEDTLRAKLERIWEIPDEELNHENGHLAYHVGLSGEWT